MPNRTAQFKAKEKEVENQAKSLLDWRGQVDKNPLAMLGVAFGGGLVLGMVLSDMGSGTGDSGQHLTGANVSPAVRQVHNVWDQMKGALIGVATAKVVEFLDEVVPGFQEHYGKHA